MFSEAVDQRVTSLTQLVQRLAGSASSAYPDELYVLLDNLLCIDPWTRVSTTDALKLSFFVS